MRSAGKGPTWKDVGGRGEKSVWKGKGRDEYGVKAEVRSKE
jgi:hypothetical protein